MSGVLTEQYDAFWWLVGLGEAYRREFPSADSCMEFVTWIAVQLDLLVSANVDGCAIQVEVNRDGA